MMWIYLIEKYTFTDRTSALNLFWINSSELKGPPQGCFIAVRLFRFYLMSMTSNRNIVDSDELGREINPVTC